MILLALALLLLASPLSAAPISPEVHAAVMQIARDEGVPESVANWLQIEESGDWRTGRWGSATAKSRRQVDGYHSRGLYQIYEEPGNLLYLVDTYWYGHDESDAFDLDNPLHSAAVALRYLAALHRRFGTWYRALCFYNAGRVRDVPRDTREYATRIVNARAP